MVDRDIEKDWHPARRRKPRKYHIKAGDKFGYWTVIEPDHFVFYKGRAARAALCRCICGKEKPVNISLLVTGRSKSCGCKRHLHQTQGQKKGLLKGQVFLKRVKASKAAAGLPHSLNKNSTTGYTGVSYQKKYGTYRAYITLGGKQIHLGSFATLEEAIKARSRAEEKYFKPYRDKIKEMKEQESRNDERTSEFRKSYRRTPV